MTNCCVVHDGSLPAELTHRNYGGGIAFMEPEPGIESTALLASELVDWVVGCVKVEARSLAG